MATKALSVCQVSQGQREAWARMAILGAQASMGTLDSRALRALGASLGLWETAVQQGMLGQLVSRVRRGASSSMRVSFPSHILLVV